MYLYFNDNGSLLGTCSNDMAIFTEDGKEYPLYKMDISNKSHPYFTGQQNLVDTSGRVEKYMKKYQFQSDKKG